MANTDFTNKIRLSEKEINSIIAIFKKHFTTDQNLWIFGSRVNMKAKGGDIDLYIELESKTIDYAKLIQQKLKFLVELKMAIGDQKIDLVINTNDKNYHLAIYNIAKTEGIKLV